MKHPLLLPLIGIAALVFAGEAKGDQAFFTTSNDSQRKILMWNASTGAYEEDFVRKLESGILGPQGCAFDAEANELFIGDGATHQIVVVDAQTGLAKRTFGFQILGQPYGLAIGPADGYVYVTDAFDTRVTRFDKSGAWLGDFIPRGSGGLQLARGIVFDLQGNLLVSSYNGNGGCSVKKYSSTGVYIGEFATTGDLSEAGFSCLDQNGDFYIRANRNSVNKYHGVTGTLLLIAADGNTTPLDYPSAPAIGPDGELYVCDRNQNKVWKYGSSNGSFLGQFCAGISQSAPEFCLFGPAPGGISPDAYSVVYGRPIGGGVFEMSRSDDAYYSIRTGIVFSQALPPIRMMFHFPAPNGDFSELRMRLEMFGSTSGLQRVIELKNVNTGAWEVIDTRMELTNLDMRMQIGPGADPDRYIDPLGGGVNARISWKPTGPVTNPQWFVQIDQMLIYFR
jgi:hypothetical protein